MAMALTVSAGTSGNIRGMGLALAAFALLSAADVIFKILATGGHPACQIMLVNGCFAMIPILIWSALTGGLHQLYTLRVPQHLARGTASVMSAFAAIYAYSRLPLTDYYAIVFVGPLIVTALSALWLGEEIGFARGVAIACGLVGIMVVANPFGHHAHAPGNDIALGRFAAFISVFCYALSVIMVRRMRQVESNLSFSFYGYSCAIMIGGSLLLLQGGPALSLADYAHLALSGTVAGISSICLMTAYHRTPVALVAPFQYSQIIWGALAGYLLWAELPGLRLLTGAAIVAGSGLFVIYCEMRARR